MNYELGVMNEKNKNNSSFNIHNSKLTLLVLKEQKMDGAGNKRGI